MATERIRGRWLTQFRARYLRLHPLCAECERKGRLSVATQLDHKVALANGGKDFDEDPDQAQGLCDDCHAAKTRLDLGQRPRRTTGLDGWPVDEG